MTLPYRQSNEATRADGYRGMVIVLAMALALLGALITWLVCARVSSWVAAEATVIIGDGAPRVVARFPGGEAIGRVQPGQFARIALTAFPWLEYGRLAGKVASVSAAGPDGAITVEIAMDRSPARLHLEAGMGAHVEVETDRVSPARFLVRAAAADTAAPDGP